MPFGGKGKALTGMEHRIFKDGALLFGFLSENISLDSEIFTRIVLQLPP